MRLGFGVLFQHHGQRPPLPVGTRLSLIRGCSLCSLCRLPCIPCPSPLPASIRPGLAVSGNPAGLGFYWMSG